MAFKPKTSVTAQEIPEDPHQLTAISFPKRAFGKKGDILRSFQSDWFKKWPFLHYNESKYVVFLPYLYGCCKMEDFVFREFGSRFCKSCMLHCLNQDIHASFRCFFNEFIYDNLK